MTILEKTYQILQQDNKEDEKYEWEKPFRPEKEFVINPFTIPETRKKKDQKVMLSKVLAFIDMKKHIRFTEGFTVISISCMNKRLLQMFGRQHTQVSRFIKFMKDIGLIADYDEVYQFNGYYNRNNKCKKYVYSYDTEVSIKQYCNNNNINKYQISNISSSNNNSVHIRAIDNFKVEDVKFNSKLNLLKPENWSQHQFEDYLIECLYVNYPQLEHYQRLADEINNTYYKDDPDRQIQFIPNITWRKNGECVTKIGIRATNALVSATKKEVLKNGKESHLTKEQVKNKYGLQYKFDVKSSVPRVTYLLNRGIWLDNSIDLYKIMYQKFAHKCPSEETEWNENTREVFKSFHMRGYFDTYSKMAGHIKRNIAMKVEYEKDTWSCLDYVMKAYKEAIEETVGELEDSEIFLHESCMYLDVTKALLDRGINVWQCYDEWNTDVQVDDIESIVQSVSVSYYNKYINQPITTTNSNTSNNNNSVHIRDTNLNIKGENKNENIGTENQRLLLEQQNRVHYTQRFEKNCQSTIYLV